MLASQRIRTAAGPQSRGSGFTRPTVQWPNAEGRGVGRGGVCCAAKRKGGGKVDDAKGQVLLEPDKGWSPGLDGLLFGPQGELRLYPELAKRQLTDKDLGDLGDDAPCGKPPDQAKKKTEKGAKEIKKLLTVEEMELAGIPVNDQLRQMLKEERRKAAKSETEQLKTKQKVPQPRDSREVHKLLKIVGGQAGGKRLPDVADKQRGGPQSAVAGDSRQGRGKHVLTEFSDEKSASSLDDAMGLFVEGLGAAQGATGSKHHQSVEPTWSADTNTRGQGAEVESVGALIESADDTVRQPSDWESSEFQSQEGVAQSGIATSREPGSLRQSALRPSLSEQSRHGGFNLTSSSAASAENEGLPESAFYDDTFLTRFQYTRPPPNRNLPLFLDVRKSGTAPEQPMPPAWQPKRSSHQGSGPLPGYPLGRVPRLKPPGPLNNGKPPEFWVVNPSNNKLVIPWGIREGPQGKAPGVKKVVQSLARKGPRTREESLGAPLTDEEAARLIESSVHDDREVYLGRDGLTWNMVQLIDTHWRRQRVCKVKCKGIYTVDMAKLVRDLETSTCGQVIWRQGGTVLLFRGRKFDWKGPPFVVPPEERSATKNRTQESHPIADRNPDGIGKYESLQLKKRMSKEAPAVVLDKNGYYGGLVQRIRERFREPTGDLAVIKCPSFVYGDIVRLAAQLKELVPASVFYLDKDRKQQIVLYRNASWQYAEDALTEVAKTDARPAYYPKGPPPRPKRPRDVLEEVVLQEVDQADEEWSSWGSVFDEPTADVRFQK